MDAVNAFYSISRPTIQWNARVLWSRCCRFLFNSYRGFALLIIKGSSAILLSKEGVTQEDPSAMKLYAIGLLPLTLKLLKTLLLFCEKSMGYCQNISYRRLEIATGKD